MVLKLWVIIFTVCLILPLVHAEENISIEDIGAEPAGLIEGMNVRFFVILNSSRTTQAEVTLEFFLDSKSISKSEKIILEPRTSKKIVSRDEKIISSNDRELMAIVYQNDTQIAKRSIEIAVQRQQVAREEGTEYPILAVLGILGGIIIIVFIIYVIKTRSSGNENGLENVIENENRNPDAPSNGTSQREEMYYKNAMFDHLKNTSEELRKQKEYIFISEYLDNIAYIIKNERFNYPEAKELDLLKRGTNDLVLKLKEAMRSNIPDKNNIAIELKQMINNADSKKQFIDVYIPYFLLTMAQIKLDENDFEVARGLIFAVGKLFADEEVIQRLRKLREIGF